MTIRKYTGFCLGHDSLRNRAHPQTPAATRDREVRAGQLQGEGMLAAIPGARGEKTRPPGFPGERADFLRTCPILGPKLKDVLRYHRHRRQSRNSSPLFHDNNQHIVSHAAPLSSPTATSHTGLFMYQCFSYLWGTRSGHAGSHVTTESRSYPRQTRRPATCTRMLSHPLRRTTSCSGATQSKQAPHSRTASAARRDS